MRWKFLDSDLKSVREAGHFEIGKWKVRSSFGVNPDEFFCYNSIADAFLGEYGSPAQILAEVEVRGEGESIKGDISDVGFERAGAFARLYKKAQEKGSVSVVEALETIERVETRKKNFKEGEETWSEMRVVKAWKITKEDCVELALSAAKPLLPNFTKFNPHDDRPQKCIDAAQSWLANPNEKLRSQAEYCSEEGWNKDKGMGWHSPEREMQEATRHVISVFIGRLLDNEKYYLSDEDYERKKIEQIVHAAVDQKYPLDGKPEFAFNASNQYYNAASSSAVFALFDFFDAAFLAAQTARAVAATAGSEEFPGLNAYRSVSCALRVPQGVAGKMNKEDIENWFIERLINNHFAAVNENHFKVDTKK